MTKKTEPEKGKPREMGIESRENKGEQNESPVRVRREKRGLSR